MNTVNGQVTDEVVELASAASWNCQLPSWWIADGETAQPIPTWEEISEEDREPYRVTTRAALEAALPLLAPPPERDYAPGTRFVVVEIPPEASDEAADEITEQILGYAGDLSDLWTRRDKGSGREPWDLFSYRQHNAPPANVPSISLDRQTMLAAAERVVTDPNTRAGERESWLRSCLYQFADELLKHECSTPYPGDYVTGDSWRCDCSQIWERTESGWVRAEVLNGLRQVTR